MICTEVEAYVNSRGGSRQIWVLLQPLSLWN